VELPEAFPSGRYVALTVAGESMEPLLHSGDTILVRLGTEATRGAIVVARHPENGYIVKRVASLQPRAIQLASLNASYPTVKLPRRGDLIVGTVVLRWCAHGAAAQRRE
jgi:phage repressor protein C with HTH and peptisase S24 domain